MIIKHLSSQIVVDTETCGIVREILTKDDGYPLGIAICIDIKPTEGHFHHTFDETYFVLDGTMTLQLYNPTNGKINQYPLVANELCVITKGIHHKIVQASEKNRLCVISFPPFHVDDEHPSDKI